MPDYEHRAHAVVHLPQPFDQGVEARAVEIVLEQDLHVARQHGQECSERLPRADGRRAEDEVGRDALAADVIGDAGGRLLPARRERALVVGEALVVPARLCVP